jgi:hypothetical protein
MKTASFVPRTWDEVTPQWMTEILAPHCAGAEVGDVALGDVTYGTTSHARARLTYTRGSGPDRVFIKGQGGLFHRLLLTSLGILFPEARLFAERDLIPLEMPMLYGVGVDRLRLRTMIVMEDVVATRGAAPNVATTPLTIDQVGAGLETLAQLHARFWNGNIPPALRFIRPWQMRAGWALMGYAGARSGLRRMGELGALESMPAGTRTTGECFKLFARQFELGRTGVQTLAHGDAHIGNSYCLPDGRIGFIDLQVAHVGSWMNDTAYFLCSALTTENRRRHEKELLARYLEALGKAGAAPPSFDQAWERYRQGPTYGLMIWLHNVGLGGYKTDEISLEVIRRFSAAFEDLGTRKAIERELAA